MPPRPATLATSSARTARSGPTRCGSTSTAGRCASHTTYRAEYRNLRHNPTMSLAILNNENALDHLKARGKPVEAIPDLTGELYVHPGVRYGDSDQQAPADSADRVILVMSNEPCTARCVRSPKYCVSVAANLTRPMRVRDSSIHRDGPVRARQCQGRTRVPRHSDGLDGPVRLSAAVGDDRDRNCSSTGPHQRRRVSLSRAWTTAVPGLSRAPSCADGAVTGRGRRGGCDIVRPPSCISGFRSRKAGICL